MGWGWEENAWLCWGVREVVAEEEEDAVDEEEEVVEVVGGGWGAVLRCSSVCQAVR
jgi:hypothetical protein